jgi:hypothetical protein
MARHGIYQKLERFLIKSFSYICEGLVLIHRHFLKPPPLPAIFAQRTADLKLNKYKSLKENINQKHKIEI